MSELGDKIKAILDDVLPDVKQDNNSITIIAERVIVNLPGGNAETTNKMTNQKQER